MIGTTISHYRILEKLGEGGMGIVYKAQDTKLDRLVALKFLPAHLSGSEQDNARFKQEAKAAAALSHPNICTIHGIEEEGGQTFIVMEFVDGQTLHDKGLNVPLKQAIEIGLQLADGLAAAHERGVVHRDLKPENIMIQKDGRVRIMDFGLAKLKGASRLTKSGSTVGSVGYMSPEQVQGMETDHRTDIFSLGVILYELFAGHSPFKGVHETAINYEIVNVDPEPVSAVKPESPPELDAIVLECLAKDSGDRYQSAAEIGKELRRFKRESSKSRVSRVTSARPVYSSAQTTTIPIEAFSSRLSKREIVLSTIAGAFLIALAIVAYLHFTAAPTSKLKAHFVLSIPSGLASVRLPSVSPDGRMIAFVGIDSSKKSLIWLRSLDATAERSIPGTEEVGTIFWSPDSRSIGYFTTRGEIKKVLIASGVVETIGNSPSGRSSFGASWGAKDVIVFVAFGNLYRIPAFGGSPELLASADSTHGELGHYFPFFLPDGEHYLFYVWSNQPEHGGIFVGSLTSKEKSMVLNTGDTAPYFASDYLVFAQDGTLQAQPTDAAKMVLKGTPTSIADRVLQISPAGISGGYSLSSNGLLAFQQAQSQNTKLVWYDRNGTRSGVAGETGIFLQIALSPDDKHLVVERYDAQMQANDLWLLDITRNVMSRFTFEKGEEVDPVWSPDSKKIVYTTRKKLLIRGLTDKQPETLLELSTPIYPDDFTPDGRFVVVHFSTQSKNQIAIVPLEGNREYRKVIESDFALDEPHVSPDGKWIVYQSIESGRYEVYGQPFMRDGQRIRISNNGGGQPRWRKDGKELLYLAPDGSLMSVDVKPGTTMDVGTPRPLFNTKITVVPFIDQFVHSKDARRFLIMTPMESGIQPIHIVLNWDADLKKE